MGMTSPESLNASSSVRGQCDSQVQEFLLPLPNNISISAVSQFLLRAAWATLSFLSTSPWLHQALFTPKMISYFSPPEIHPGLLQSDIILSWVVRLPPQQAPTICRPPLWAATSLIETLNMADLDFMSQILCGTQKKSLLSWWLQILPLGLL